MHILGTLNHAYGGLPPQIFKCRNLRKMWLGYQTIAFIPDDIGKLKKLNMLTLSNNPALESISAQLGKAALYVLNISDCPNLKTPPKAILNQGTKVTIAYLKRLSQGSTECYRTKLMFVGLGGAGKTSLTRALMSTDLRAPVLTSDAITDGIDISTWTVKTDTFSLQFSVWDFAGQTVYYNTHQFFLSGRSVYLLVWNTRLGYEHSGLDFWLRSIACHCPNAPVLIVGTHTDQVTKSDLPTEAIKAVYPNVAGFFNVSSVEGLGIKELYNALIEATLKLPYIGELIPECWQAFERSLISKRNLNLPGLLQWKIVEDMANTVGIYGDEVKQAVRFLHELGTIQHFENDQLKDQVVINPQWIVDVMACVISVHTKYIEDGVLKHSQLGSIWKAKEYPVQLHEWMLRLTELFDLTFPLPGKNVSIVPCLLPAPEPKFTWPKPDAASDLKETKLLYTFDYLPAGLFNRAQVRLQQFSETSSMWKSGSLLKKNNHTGLIQQLSTTNLVIKVVGSEPENILLMIHEVFEDLINVFFQGVKYEYQIPCPDCVAQRTEEPTMFTSQVLRRAIELKALFLQCHTFFHTLSISEIQRVMLPQSSSDYLLQINSTIQSLSALEDRLGTHVFLLYCDSDYPKDPPSDVIGISKVYEDLGKQGITCWFSEDLHTMNLDQIAIAMKTCKIVVVFISDQFAENEHCKRMFQFAKETLRKEIQLVMVGQGRGWMKSDFIGIQTTQQVYINFQRSSQYEERFKELVTQLQIKLKNDHQTSSTDTYDVFLSYAWANSATLCKKGYAREKDGSLGFGDPCEIKEFLESNGLTVWMDKEQVGRMGLYEDISSGMKRSKIVVACISDEYTMSSNCQIEFRFAHSSLRKPIVLAVMGTETLWESTEIGMLSLGYPKVNFQINRSSNNDNLLDYVVEALDGVDDIVIERPLTPDHRLEKEMAFQELYELAQRKFLRQISNYSSGNEHYPRLMVLDLAQDPSELEDVSVDEDCQPRESEPVVDNVQILKKYLKPGMFCVKLLCEYEGGWHTSGSSFSLDLDSQDLERVWQAGSGYLGQILTILKHSNVDLNFVRTLDGQRLIQQMETLISQYIHTDMQPFYKILRTFLLCKDQGCTKAGLRRCYLPSGKHLWLCDRHQNLPRITPLDDDVVDVATDGSVSAEQILVDALNNLNTTDSNWQAASERSKSASAHHRPSNLRKRLSHERSLHTTDTEDVATGRIHHGRKRHSKISATDQENYAPTTNSHRSHTPNIVPQQSPAPLQSVKTQKDKTTNRKTPPVSLANRESRPISSTNQELLPVSPANQDLLPVSLANQETLSPSPANQESPNVYNNSSSRQSQKLLNKPAKDLKKALNQKSSAMVMFHHDAANSSHACTIL